MAQREELKTVLRKSGPAIDSLATQARDLVTQWKSLLRKEDGVRIGVSDIECFRAGCFFEVDYSDEGVHMAVRRNFEDSSIVTEGWQGAKIITGPEKRATGRVVTMMILLAPMSAEG
jgi:hypothetical protein